MLLVGFSSQMHSLQSLQPESPSCLPVLRGEKNLAPAAQPDILVWAGERVLRYTFSSGIAAIFPNQYIYIWLKCSPMPILHFSPNPFFSWGPWLSCLVSAEKVIAWQYFIETVLVIFCTYRNERVCGSSSLTPGSFMHMKLPMVLLSVFKYRSEHITSAQRTVPVTFHTSLSAPNKILSWV